MSLFGTDECQSLEALISRSSGYIFPALAVHLGESFKYIAIIQVHQIFIKGETSET